MQESKERHSSEEVSIAFWNLKRKNLAELVTGLVQSNAVDILVLLEHTGTDPTDLQQKLGDQFYEIEDPALYAVKDPLIIPARIFARKSLVRFTPLKADSHRYIAVTLIIGKAKHKIILVAVHLPAKGPGNSNDEQATAAVGFAQDIVKLERQRKLDNGREIKKSVLQPDVGDVRAPDLIHAHDRDVTQEVRKDPVLGVPLGQPGLGIDSFQAHQPHQALNALPVERYSV